MILRLLVTALCAVAFAMSPASAQTPDLATIARGSGTPEIPGLKMVWLAPWGDVAKAHPWRNIIVHQTEGPAGSARGGAEAQSKNPTRRGVTVWVETDGTVYWAVRGKSGADPWRRRQPQRQQVHRQRPDLSPGDRQQSRSAWNSPATIPT